MARALQLTCVLWASSMGIQRSSLEMQNPRPHFSAPESEPAFQKIARLFLQALYCLRSKGLAVTLGMSSERRAKVLSSPPAMPGLLVCAHPPP